MDLFMISDYVIVQDQVYLLNDLLFEISLLIPSFMDNYEVQGPQLLNLNLENICLEDHKNIFFVKINP